MSTEKALRHFAAEAIGLSRRSEGAGAHPQRLLRPASIPSRCAPAPRPPPSCSTKRGFENVQLLEIAGAHPYVYGEILQGAGQARRCCSTRTTTCSRPATRRVEDRRPSSRTERDGRLYGARRRRRQGGRGRAHLAPSTPGSRARGALPLNVKVVIEGEEEMGSEHLERVPAAAQRRCCRPTPSSSPTPATSRPGLPSITTALRGLVTVDVEVRALKQSRALGHVGRAGPRSGDGAVPDAGVARRTPTAPSPSRASLDKVKPLTRRRAARASPRCPADDATFREQAGMLAGRAAARRRAHPWETNWRQPSLAVNAIQASSRKDARNIIYESAWRRQRG